MKRLSITLLAIVLALPAPVLAAGLSPEQAEQRRSEVLAEAGSLGPAQAVDMLRREAEELGDPELFLSASERLREHAEAEADEDLAQDAAALADVARDIALYLTDERRYDATDWRPVTREQALTLADRAEQAATDARELAATIVREREAAAAAANVVEEPSDERRERKPGTGLIAGGAAMLTIGVAGVAMIGAGLAMGAARQREAEALILPAEQARLDELDREGAKANRIAYIGIAVAGVGLISGIALVVVGVKKRKAGPAESASLRATPWFGRDAAGLSVGGRF